ncbi:MAG: hypothetical protein KDK36_03185 [Leptospiraceae bacterium]|nr:hypothetical protein [Leptospiraceae bacterium]
MKILKKLLSYLILFSLLFVFFGMASSPKSILKESSKKNKELFSENGYKISSKKFQFILKNKGKVRFIITPSYYRVRTAIGISTDGTAEKIKVLVYRLNEKEDQKGELLEASMEKEEYHFWELEDRAHHFMIEIIMLDSRGGEFGSNVELVHGYKDPPEDLKDPDFKYHTDEGEKPTGKQEPPCIPQNRYGSCSPEQEGIIYRLD